VGSKISNMNSNPVRDERTLVITWEIKQKGKKQSSSKYAEDRSQQQTAQVYKNVSKI